MKSTKAILTAGQIQGMVNDAHEARSVGDLACHVLALALSHERLRAELAGCQSMLDGECECPPCYGDGAVSLVMYLADDMASSPECPHCGCEFAPHQEAFAKHVCGCGYSFESERIVRFASRPLEQRT